MNKYNLMCLFFAKNIDYKILNNLFKKIKNDFEISKFKKHFMSGKTTIHRKGKEDKKLSVKRNNLRKISTIIYYYKNLKINPDLAEVLDGFKTNKTINDFLQ